MAAASSGSTGAVTTHMHAQKGCLTGCCCCPSLDVCRSQCLLDSLRCDGIGVKCLQAPCSISVRIRRHAFLLHQCDNCCMQLDRQCMCSPLQRAWQQSRRRQPQRLRQVWGSPILPAELCGALAMHTTPLIQSTRVQDALSPARPLDPIGISTSVHSKPCTRLQARLQDLSPLNLLQHSCRFLPPMNAVALVYFLLLGNLAAMALKL